MRKIIVGMESKFGLSKMIMLVLYNLILMVCVKTIKTIMNTLFEERNGEFKIHLPNCFRLLLVFFQDIFQHEVEMLEKWK